MSVYACGGNSEVVVSRATVSFKRSDGVSEGWLVNFPDSAPRIGEQVVLRDQMGETVQRGRVTDVRHLLFSGRYEYRAAATDLEIDVDASDV